MKTVLGEYNSILYCPRSKRNGEYLTERYEYTDDISEAIGWESQKLCEEDILHLDEPDEWETVKKITTMIMFKMEE